MVMMLIIGLKVCLMSQNAISNMNSNRGGVRKLPYAFTEQGVAMWEISDRLIHSAPRSVSLVHYTFRNDIPFVIPQPLAHEACE